jgi:hypothetical protein
MGREIGQKEFTYDAQGNLLREQYTESYPTYGDSEKIFEYDFDNNLISVALSYSNEFGAHEIKTHYAYEAGLLRTEYSTYNNNRTGYLMEYYYSAALPDSVRTYGFMSDDGGRYLYLYTTLYVYDNLGRKVRSFANTTPDSYTEFSYRNGQLASECYVNPNFQSCRVKEYNLRDQLMRVTFEMLGNSQLEEEYIYDGNLLIEKKVYTYQPYVEEKQIDIRSIRYQYE